MILISYPQKALKNTVTRLSPELRIAYGVLIEI